MQEVILATSSTVEGDATALYVARLVAELGVKASRLAQGMPKGGELEYADDVTLTRALSGRSTISS
jgi:recombination protein RecR